MRATSPRRHVQHIFRDKETGREGGKRRWEGRGEGDELFVVSCTLHPRTLTPRYPVYRVDPLPLTVSSITSATSASDICTPALSLSTKEFYLWRNFTRCSFDAKIILPLISVRIITARCLDEISSSLCNFPPEYNSASSMIQMEKEIDESKC